MLLNPIPTGIQKEMTRAKRKLIGRVALEAGEIIPTDGRNRKKILL